MSILRRVIESLPGFYERIPDQSLIVAPLQVEDGDEPLGDTLIGGMRSATWIAAHLPHGGEVTVSLDPAIFGAQWRAEWLDPKTGARETFTRDTRGATTLTARSPSEGSIDCDWVLLVIRDTPFD